MLLSLSLSINSKRKGEKMKPASNNKEKHNEIKEERNFQNIASPFFFYLTCVTLIAIFSLHFIFNNKNINYTNHIHNFIQTTNASTPPNKGKVEGVESCDLFKGRWIRDPNVTLYTNFTCTTIPSSRNCFLNGRKDRDFLNWKWKPDECELPRFSALSFLSILRGKKMAFIGDSLARNQVESLLCLLSTVEIPESRDEKQNAKNRTWEFREHNFTLSVLWSQFLAAAGGIAGTRGFNVFLDRADFTWSSKLHSIDYAVFSASYWFSRPNYFHVDSHVIGCVDCVDPDVADLKPGRAIRLAFRAALRAVNGCGKKVVSFVRTTSADHFENGSWNEGGRCNRTRPVEREEVDRAKPGPGYSKIQLEEVESARSEGEGKGNVFEFLDVTDMMAMRVDGHPDRHGGLMRKGASDCLHWCLPGPIDTWNELLLERIKRLNSKSSHN